MLEIVNLLCFRTGRASGTRTILDKEKLAIKSATMRYSASPEVLDSDDPAQIAWDAIAPIWDDLPLDEPHELSKFMEELTPGQRGLIALDWCQKEIRNGGFAQLFWNSTGALVPQAIDGFKLIGVVKYADIISSVATMLGREYPISRVARAEAYKRLDQHQLEQIKNFETEFYSLLRSTGEDLEPYRGNYVRSNPHEFIIA